MSGEPERRLRLAPNPLLAAILTSSKPDLEWKNIANLDFSTTC